MATVWIPSLLRKLTNNKSTLEVQGVNILDLIDSIDEEYSGFKARLVENDKIRPEISVVIDGVVSSRDLATKVESESEVHFLPVLSGGLLIKHLGESTQSL